MPLRVGVGSLALQDQRKGAGAVVWAWGITHLKRVGEVGEGDSF